MAAKGVKKSITGHRKGAPESIMRDFPSISTVLEDEGVKILVERWSFAFVGMEVKKIASAMKKEAARTGRMPSKDDIIMEVKRLFGKYRRELIQPVINGTGVILHTNLGRAPISSVAYEGLLDAVTGYSNLEFDLVDGKRSKRSLMPGRMLAALSGAEAGMAVNNNAAAVYLIVANIAGPGREVIISRGQLIQIGGGFRIPEIIERSGAKLREVGTTNKTNLGDYQKAMNKNTALILYVHKSNFVQRGFTDEAEVSAIARLARQRKIPFCFDLGSGWIDSGAGSAKLAEPSVSSAIRTGADLVCFSGDKLLGGPQAGLIAGKEKMISNLLNDPLYRAFRLDKLTIGLLEATLQAHLRGESLPCWEMASAEREELRARADEIVLTVSDSKVTPTILKSSFGGGSLPEYEFDSFGVKIEGDPQDLSRQLLGYSTPVVCRTISDGVMIDLRTVLQEQMLTLIDAIKSCL
ncbi:MAG: L-seryl-tRNA(Sec) selenium transferase [candidate division Zixibacteria bacterium RBG_16_53_22]|nr:MAG: L-seryl-tRNA(Sec) selenium transferase [candidate division Zixibacteria bacterium RBG_16_53_22]